MRRLLLLATAVCQAQTAPTPGTIRVDVNLVTVACSVSDSNGAPVKNLRREDFKLLDEGKPREIQYFWQESDLPLTVGLIADVSGSEVGIIRKHRELIEQFLAQVIGPQDRAFIVTVASEVRLLRDLTNSTEELRAGVEEIEAGGRRGVQLGEPCRGPGAPRGRRRIFGCGGTALWNSVYAAARLKMKPLTGRKALIVLTDGMDTGSFHHLTDAIEAAQSADTLVYTIRAVSPMAKFGPSVAGQIALALGGKHLVRLSEETGGEAVGLPKDPATVFTRIENELRNLYVLGFTPPEGVRDGKFHKIEVKGVRGDLKIRARKGYVITPAAAVVE